MKQILELGAVVGTTAALRFCENQFIDVLDLVHRHASGDDGNICAEDKESNQIARVNQERVLSSYKFTNGSVWIITEADRSSTCVLLPDEY